MSGFLRAFVCVWQRDKPSRLTHEAIEKVMTNPDPPGRGLYSRRAVLCVHFLQACAARISFTSLCGMNMCMRTFTTTTEWLQLWQCQFQRQRMTTKAIIDKQDDGHSTRHRPYKKIKRKTNMYTLRAPYHCAQEDIIDLQILYMTIVSRLFYLQHSICAVAHNRPLPWHPHGITWSKQEYQNIQCRYVCMYAYTHTYTHAYVCNFIVCGFFCSCEPWQ